MAVFQLFRTLLHGAGRALERVEKAPQSGYFKEEPVDHGLDHPLFEQEHLGHEIVIVHGQSRVVIEDQSRTFRRNVFHAHDVEAVPNPALDNKRDQKKRNEGNLHQGPLIIFIR